MARGWVLLLCLSAFGQEISKTWQAGTWQAGEVTLTLRVTPKNPVVADEVRVELEAIAPKDVHVEMPGDPGAIDCANVLDRESPPPTVKSGRMTHRAIFLLDPIGPGTCHIPALPVRYGNSAMATEEVAFPIASLIPAGETSPDIRDGQTPLGLREPNINWTVVALGTLVVLAVVAWLTFGGKQPVQIPIELEPPEVRARRRLAKLALCEQPAPREFYTELSRILTAYLDERLGTRSTRCTSLEILEAVRRTGYLNAATRDLLEALLEDCDCAKFSPTCALGDNPGEAVVCCRKIIDILCAQAASASRWSAAGNGLAKASVLHGGADVA